MSSPPHVVIIGNQAGTMLRFRGSLISLLVERGVRVTAVCPDGTPDEQEALAELGIGHVSLNHMSRSSLNPFADIRLITEISGILGSLTPSHVLSYFLKPAIYGTIAAWWAGVPKRIASIEGLGFVFTDAGSPSPTVRLRVVRELLVQLLRFGLSKANRVIVLNRDDERFVRDRCGVPSPKLARLEGIGVDLRYFSRQPPWEGNTTFCLIARLVREKGVIDFIEAARTIKARVPEARILLIGGLDDNPGAISRAQIEEWVAAGLVIWPGRVTDVRPYLTETSVFVLPSYREGFPRSTMEAMSMGRAVVTTDVPGCRESITAEVSGILVPPRDPDALAAALLRFIDDTALAIKMGEEAAREAERRYDARKQDSIIAEIILSDPQPFPT